MTEGSEQMLVFNAIKPANKIDPDNYSSTLQKQIYTAQKRDGEWINPRPMRVNAPGSLVATYLSPDGRKMLISGNMSGGPDLNIYEAAYRNGAADKLHSPGTGVNSKYVETSSSFSADEQILFFASKRPGGIGGSDIYMVKKT